MSGLDCHGKLTEAVDGVTLGGDFQRFFDVNGDSDPGEGSVGFQADLDKRVNNFVILLGEVLVTLFTLIRAIGMLCSSAGRVTFF